MAKFVEMQVDSIRVHMPSGQHVVILKEKETDRYLPIWIGIYEANAIALKITGITPERPITHDLLANILQSAEMRLKKIQVTSLTNEVFFARLFLGVNGKEIEIDSRPSDAIALAVRMTCPILVSQDVLDKAGVFPEKEEEEERGTESKPRGRAKAAPRKKKAEAKAEVVEEASEEETETRPARRRTAKKESK